ncbi:MAG: hypothetical protein JWR52_3506 [Marmoricola sp.]|nr:hypothetical protein [Marmoricola sp.]
MTGAKGQPTEQSGRRGLSRRQRGVMLGVLLVGTVTGLVVGGAMRGFGDDRAGNAASARVTSPLPSSEPPPGSSQVIQGDVIADAAAGALTTDIAPGRTHTPDGAVSAFTAYATWLVGSPAAAAHPGAEGSVVGRTLINPADAGLLAAMHRQSGDRFDAQHGAYRVIAHAGDAAAPDAVMIEVTAPLTLGGKTEWRTIGGVVGWTPDGWQLVSIEPRATAQPTITRGDVRAFPADERAHTFDGLGWRTYRLASR